MTKITRKPDGTITFDLTISATVIAKEYQKVLKAVAKTAVVKGFRPGKAPLSMVEAGSNISQLYSHVLDHVLSPAYSDAIHKHKLIPLLDPHVNPKSMEQGKDWVMAVEIAIAPDFKLGDYQAIVQTGLKKHPKHAHKTEKEESEHKLNIIFDALLDHLKFDVCPILIEEETKSALSRLANQLKSLKLSVEDYAKSIKKTTKELIAEYQKSAESNLKLEFILQAIAQDKKFEGKEVRRQTLDFLSAL
jgi:FKBP-type peptidyl-prolyl cis-trans isomerase (trigger factor)